MAQWLFLPGTGQLMAVPGGEISLPRNQQYRPQLRYSRLRWSAWDPQVRRLKLTVVPASLVGLCSTSTLLPLARGSPSLAVPEWSPVLFFPMFRLGRATFAFEVDHALCRIR
jgi:hypothetical protein